MTLDLARRSFLGGALALGGSVALARVMPDVPTLWGDGIHDDAPGLQALFDRKPVTIMRDEIVVQRAGIVRVEGGRFLLRKHGLVLRNDHGPIHLIGNWFLAGEDFPQDQTAVTFVDWSLAEVREAFDTTTIVDGSAVGFPVGFCLAMRAV